ncbi:MAG: tetratricopeptide repeat protein, partial [Bacteroidota bacterium]
TGILIVAIRLLKKHKILSFGIFFYLISVLVFSNIIVPINGIIGERLIYIASLGFSIIIGYILFELRNIMKVKIIPVILLIVILVSCSFKTINRNFNWKNETTLFENDIKYLQNSAKANGVYATKILFELADDPNAKSKNHKIIEAINHFSRSIEIYPEYYSSWNNLGYIYFMFYGTPDKAIFYFDKALEIRPEYPEALYYTGLCYETKGDYDSAVEFYEKAFDVRPEYIDVISKLANWNNKIGNYNKSIELNKRLIEIDADLDIPYINVGNYFYLKNDLLNALKYWELAYKTNPDNIYMLNNIVNLTTQLGLTDKSELYREKLKNQSKR